MHVAGLVRLLLQVESFLDMLAVDLARSLTSMRLCSWALPGSRSLAREERPRPLKVLGPQTRHEFREVDAACRGGMPA